MPGYSGSSTSVEKKESFENMVSKSDFSQKYQLSFSLFFVRMVSCTSLRGFLGRFLNPLGGFGGAHGTTVRVQK